MSMSRVSSPERGAKRRPTPTPSPSPTRKLPNLSIRLFPLSRGRKRLARNQFQYTVLHRTAPLAESVKLCTAMQSPKPRAKLAEDALFEYAVRSLANRACSSDELRFKLRQRAAKFSDIDPVIARLKELGYLDDKRFAEM